MNANLTTHGKIQEFTKWQDLIEYLSAYEDKKQAHTLNISVHTAQTFWQYTLDLDTNSALQVVYMLKDIEYKVDKIWERYLDALSGDD